METLEEGAEDLLLIVTVCESIIIPIKTVLKTKGQLIWKFSLIHQPFFECSLYTKMTTTQYLHSRIYNFMEKEDIQNNFKSRQNIWNLINATRAECKTKIWYVHTVEYCLPFKRSGVLVHVIIGANPEKLMLRKTG